jgi:hypothetical protein
VSRTRALVVAAVVLVVVAAVGAISAVTRDSRHTFVLPRCARPAHALVPPPPFPRTLPLPKGTAFSTLARYPKAIVLGGRAPLELLPATAFFVRELPRKGFALGPGESEPGLEAEVSFTGAGVLGRFKVRVLPRCRGAVLLVISITSAASPSRPAPSPVRGVLPACAGTGAAVASGLPPSFPLPKGALIRSSTNHAIRGQSFHFVAAVAPGSIGGAARFLLRRLPRAGYRLTGADREATEAEATFVGHGLEGRVRFHTLLACPGALTIDIASSRR